jgi:hypothetical protein
MDLEGDDCRAFQGTPTLKHFRWKRLNKKTRSHLGYSL